MTEIVTVEINCPDAATAAAIAEALVGRRLAACANIHAPIDSLYHWRGRIERAARGAAGAQDPRRAGAGAGRGGARAASLRDPARSSPGR